MGAAEAATWFPGLLTGPISETVIGLTGVGLMVNDLRKLYLNWNEDDSEEKEEQVTDQGGESHRRGQEAGCRQEAGPHRRIREKSQRHDQRR